jgi:alginate O-acetyltransferase complex protein AlgI
VIFNTSWFLLFFIFFYCLLWLIPSPRARFLYVLACSAVFQYHFAGPAGVAPIIAMAIATYFFALWIPRCGEGSRKKSWVFLLSLLAPVGGLIAFKYRALLLGPLVPLANDPVGGWISALAVQPALPLGLSFFTFEFVHYLTDIYRGRGAPVRDPFKFGIFCLFFPSIVSGPIKRFQPFLAQLEEGLPSPPLSKVGSGAAQLLLGFFKKLVIADSATMLIHLLEKRTDLTFAPMCLLLALLSIRILFDFSGYSDIAIGLGKMIGLDLPVNFNFPYISRNISEFWQRWHISLSSWIRDYIYISLGGNRYGTFRKFLNLIITMFLCGLWHGASWHFGLWGAYHGLGLVLHDTWEKTAIGRRFASWGWSRWAGIGINNVFVAYGWLLFFYPMAEVAKYTKCLFRF